MPLFSLWRGSIVAGALALALLPQPAAAQESSDVEAEAKRQRAGAGLRVGAWDVDTEPPASVDQSRTPAFEGYFQKGLDLHLAIESTVGVWRRRQTRETSDAFGGTSTEEVDTYIVPLFTALKFYPFTRPSDVIEPYVNAGVGFALGIDDRKNASDGFLGGSSGSPSVVTGFGFKGGAGLEWRFSDALGLSAGARYQWVRFGNDVGGERTYKGPVFEGGLTYRFQYR